MPLPHICPFAPTPIYFFTACTAQRRAILNDEVSHRCLRSIWEQAAARNGWYVGRYVLMPDHVHFFASPSASARSRAEWLKLWKSISARELAMAFRIEPPIWQPDTFDHVMRSRESYAAKWEYVRLNPVRRGLVADSKDWAWQGEIHRLEVR